MPQSAGDYLDSVYGWMPSQYVDQIKKFEGFTPRAGWDYKRYTNGYGTQALHPGEVIDKETADQRLEQELAKARSYVDRIAPDAPVGIKSALASLTFNSGTKWANSGLGQSVQAGDWDAARNQFLQYNKAGGQTLPGLADRRAQEAQWFGGDIPQSQPMMVGEGQPGAGWRDTPPIQTAYTETPTSYAQLFGPSGVTQDGNGGVTWSDGSFQKLFGNV